MTTIRATEDILIPKPGQIGAFELAYKEGDLIREEDIPALEALGVNVSGKKAKAAPAEDKAKRGPREAKKATTRDKAMTEKEEDDG
jgi:hypothetical protein